MGLAINSLIRLYGIPAAFYFDKLTKNPQKTQSDFLIKLLRKNAASAFGKSHGFASIKTEMEYRKQVPIREYEEFRPYINQILTGKKSVLTAEDPVRFNLTSGTTGEPKFIPVTEENLNQEIRLIGQWYYRALRDHPQFLDHFRVAIVSPSIEGKTSLGVPFGSASGMIFHRIPQFIRKFYAIPESVSEIKDYEERYFQIARFAAAKKVSFLLTPNPSTFVRLANVMNQHGDKIIRAIHEGEEGKIAPDSERAKFLKNILDQTGGLRPRDVWPELKLLACWLGGSVGIQAHKLSAYYGDLPLRDIGYMASEAHITIPQEDNTSSGILAVQANYYEFIPEDSHGAQNPSVLSCHQLEKRKRYALLLTTTSGLYRYDINDIVEVTGFYQQTPVLAFIRKGRDMTNMTGEKLHANHVLFAVHEMRQKFNLSVEYFRAIPDIEKGRYSIYLEFNSNPPDDEAIKNEMIPFMDQMLAKANIEYSQKRQSKRLKLPCLCLMRRGWAEEECKKFMQGGKREVQYKWRVICPEPSAEDIAAVINIIEKKNE